MQVYANLPLLVDCRMSVRHAGRSLIDCDLTENAKSAGSCFGKRLLRIKGKAEMPARKEIQHVKKDDQIVRIKA